MRLPGSRSLVAFASRFGVNSISVIFPESIDMRLFSKRIAWVCLLLTFWSAIGFVAHHHSSAAEAAKCTVCVAAHSASPKAASTVQKTSFVRVSALEPEPVSARHQRLIAFALSAKNEDV
jgi:hypothetical protein